MCTDEFVNSHNGTGITLETGYRGINPLQVSLGFSLLLKLFRTSNPLKQSDLEEISKNLSNEKLKLFTWSEIYPWPGQEAVTLKENLHNFDYIREGAVLGQSSGQTVKTKIQVTFFSLST